MSFHILLARQRTASLRDGQVFDLLVDCFSCYESVNAKQARESYCLSLASTMEKCQLFRPLTSMICRVTSTIDGAKGLH